MAQLFTNNAATTLAQPLAAGATTLVVTSSTTFPVLGAGDFFLATLIGHDANGNEAAWEIVRVTEVAGNAWTVERAQEGTPDISWSQAARVELRLTAGSLLAPVSYAERLTDLEAAMTESVRSVGYLDRTVLRTLEVGRAVVEGLGLFVWHAGSDEPDDDESCFATENGRWLLEAVHWDVVDAWKLPDEEARDDRDEDAESRWPGRVLFGTANQSITSINAVTQVAFATTVIGATPNDHVIVTPPSDLGGRISVFARVTAVDTVTIYLNNPSAAAQVLVTGDWRVAVIQEN